MLYRGRLTRLLKENLPFGRGRVPLPGWLVTAGEGWSVAAAGAVDSTEPSWGSNWPGEDSTAGYFPPIAGSELSDSVAAVAGYSESLRIVAVAVVAAG